MDDDEEKEIEEAPNSKAVTKLELRNERLKQWGIIVVAVAGLVSSIIANVMPERETKAKSAYQELSAAVKQINQDQRKMYSDIAAIHGYLAAKENMPPGFTSTMPDEIKLELAEMVANMQKEEAAVIPRTTPQRVASAPRAAAAKPAPKTETTGSISEPVAAAEPALPDIAPAPEAYEPPSVDSL